MFALVYLEPLTLMDSLAVHGTEESNLGYKLPRKGFYAPHLEFSPTRYVYTNKNPIRDVDNSHSMSSTKCVNSFYQGH